MSKARKSTPHGLTEHQCDLLDALLEHGSPKAVAHEMGIATRTVSNTLREIRRKMGASTVLLAAIRWDRLQRVREGSAQRARSVFEIGAAQ